MFAFFFSSRRRHTRWPRDWSSDVCSSDLFRESPFAGVYPPVISFLPSRVKSSIAETFLSPDFLPAASQNILPDRSLFQMRNFSSSEPEKTPSAAPDSDNR